MSGASALADAVAELVQYEGSDKASDFADRLERGDLSATSPASVLQTHMSVSHPRLRFYRDAIGSSPDIHALVLALRISARTAQAIAEREPLVEVAWTFPGPSRPGLRTTGGVSRELIDASKRSLLVVGYSVTVDAARTGLAAQSVDAIARAAERGVVVTAVLHRNVNLSSLLSAWREGVPLPAVYTWPEANDDMASVHAKLLIADRADALVTSANLTYHGFEGNLEMGVRVTGPAAGDIDDRLRDLISAGVFVEWAMN